MTNNPTIDGVSRVSLQQVLEAYDYANSHPHKYLRGTTNWCAAVAHKLNELQRGIDAPVVERQPAAFPGYPPVPDDRKMAPPEVTDLQESLTRARKAHALSQGELRNKNESLQSTIAQLQARIAELESGRGDHPECSGNPESCPENEGFGCCVTPSGNACPGDGVNACKKCPQPSDAPPAPVAVVEKYDEVLLPFLALMRAELHANAHKGDRPGWLQMDRKTAILEVFYHMGKLHQAVHRGEEAAIKEYAADVANMCMMLLDVCACLDATAALNGERK